MASIGDRLTTEREARGMTIEQVAEATGVSVVYLQAMETGAFDALPGPAFGKLYIRAYADVLDFDPRPLIEEYDRELRLVRGDSAELPRTAPAGSRPVAEAIARWKASKTVVRDEPAIEPLPEEPVAASVEVEESALLVEAVEVAVPELTAPVARPRRGIATSLAVAAIVIAAGIYFMVRGSATHDVATVVPAEHPREVPPPVASPPAAVPPPSAPVVSETASPHGTLSVTEFGMGRRIVRSRLEGEGSSFAEGEVACFQTRVLGGRAGDSVRHVWIYDGHAQQSIALRLGGPDWRTHSKKTIYRSGTWTVEARDKDGRVLATASFTCVPAGR